MKVIQKQLPEWLVTKTPYDYPRVNWQDIFFLTSDDGSEIYYQKENNRTHSLNSFQSDLSRYLLVGTLTYHEKDYVAQECEIYSKVFVPGLQDIYLFGGNQIYALVMRITAQGYIMVNGKIHHGYFENNLLNNLCNTFNIRPPSFNYLRAKQMESKQYLFLDAAMEP